MGRKLAEQRVSDRVPVGAPATIRWGEEELSGFLELLNLAGGYVATGHVPELGEYVELNFQLPGDRRIFRVRGSVVFVGDSPIARTGGFGTRFERPPAALLDAIKNLNRGH
ncbi:MAG TPA: PilZ domain-containing protein [Thermoanaerobaculia bacterium]|nr:PilZ domain-containing protein [Thermoanaerobaculia bacterium]